MTSTPAPSRPAGLRLHWRLVFQVAFTGGMVALIVWRTDLGDAWQIIRSVNAPFAIAGMAALILSNVVHTVKWQVLLEGVGRVPFRDLFAVFWSSMTTNNVIPFRAGDLLRVQVLGQRTGIPRAGIVATLLTERVLDAACFLILLAVGIPALHLGSEVGVLALALSAFVAVLLVVTVLVARVQVMENLEHRVWLRFLPRRLRRPVVGILPSFIAGLRPIGSVSSGLRSGSLALLAWGLEGVAFFLWGEAFGLDLSFASYLVVMVAVNFVGSLTILPANLGLFELTAVELLRALGASPGEAGAYAVGSHVLLILSISVVGVVTLWYLRIGLDDIFYLRGRGSPAQVVETALSAVAEDPPPAGDRGTGERHVP